MNLSILSRFSKVQRFIIRLIFYLIFLLLFIPALFAYKIARPPRIESSHTTPDLFDLPYHAKEWQTRDGILIRGWLIPSPKKLGLFILVHGIGDSKDAYLPRAKMIFDSGYSVLLYDHRAHGESGGRFSTLGIREAEDLRTLIQATRKEIPSSIPIYLWGFSMGAATILNTLPFNPQADGIIVDSSYPSIKETFHQHAKSMFSVTLFPLDSLTHFFYRLLTGTTRENVSPFQSVHRTRGYPIFFVGRADDGRIPPSQARQLFDAYQGGKKELWIIPGANHLYDGGKEHEYWRRILEFLTL